MKNQYYDLYKYTKKTKTSFKLVVSDTGDTQTDLPHTIILTDFNYLKNNKKNNASYFISQSKKHISKLTKFDNADYYFGDILKDSKDKKKYLLIVKINETDLELHLFKNENAINEKLKSLEIVKNEIA